MGLSIRRRITLAQVVPLATSALLGLVMVWLLVHMTASVQEARTLGVERIQVMSEVVDRFREEVVLLQRYRETMNPSFSSLARKRSTQVRTRLVALSKVQGPPALVRAGLKPLDIGYGELELLLTDFEQLAGLTGPPGDEKEVERAARHLLRTLRDRHDGFQLEQQRQLAHVAEVSSATATGIVLTVGLLLLAGMFGTVWASGSIVRDLEVLEAGTDAVAAGDFEYRIQLEASSSEKSGSVGLGRDDEFGRLALAFNRMAARLAELDRMKVDFFANVSHDLKTPLTSILEAVDLLDEEVAGPVTEDQRRLITVMKGSGMRLRALVENLLDLSRIGDSHPALQPGDVVATVDVILEQLNLSAESRDVRLKRTVDQDLPLVLVNRGMLEQVLQNLVGNGIKFCRRGGVVEVRLSVAAPEVVEDMDLTGGRAVLISVVDQGPGIPLELRERVFDRFYQAPDQEERGGTGLGLYIAKKIVESHGGAIWLDDGADGGAAVLFTLAVAEGATDKGLGEV
jgi:signal transduction histidine kinase